ncbi:ABC transporter permease [Paenibacillus sp. DXFW5]|uniref:ABC transporter permease n=1 Tax=Paenibacillus rhizolycopersici TaxID=2780073 RepID=A0ABS2H002_9BACL|nr:ABC transporter permease [Paenibacillus rhizolycopersici]MBM6994572.1 ABC transporter permease [Paenibacillus rhizolycopersici]
MNLRSLWHSIWPPLVAVMLFLLIWQGATAWFHIEKWILPSPVDIGREAAAGAASLGEHTLATLRLMLIGFAIGTLVGLLMAFVLHYVPFLKASLYPLIILSQNVPTIALAPLLMIWFGFGILPKIIVITLVCFFPVAVATMDGLSRTDRAMLDYMRMIGASKADIFRKLEVPYAIPSIMSGVKIAATYSVMGAVIAEWIGADKGIGYYMMLQKASFRTDKIFVAIAIIVAISLAMFACVALLEKWLVRYKPSNDRS